MTFKYRDYDPKELEKLHAVFLRAFSDYFVTFSPKLEQFKTRIEHKLNIQPHLSRLAWDGGRPVGFVLHTLNAYNGKQTLYNGGTGVDPDYRRQQIATRLYHQVLANIPLGQVDRILLEVVAKNQPGIKLYESLGFQFYQVVKCFKLYSVKGEIQNTAEIRASDELKAVYKLHQSFLPSFMDSTEQLAYNLKHERILEAYKDESLTGYVIFQPRLGRISQLAVDPKHRNLGIGRQLIQQALLQSDTNYLTLMNIPEDQHDTIDSLYALGFQNELDQIELELNV